jgi:predicted aspartyl protease
VAPIKRRIGGTPVIDVTFNGNKQFEMILDTGASGTVITQAMADALGIIPVAKAKANTASAKAVEFPVGYVDSMEAAGIVVRKVGVAIAGSELETGLLVHDFFGDYEITIKRDAIEFRPPSHHQQLNSSET